MTFFTGRTTEVKMRICALMVFSLLASAAAKGAPIYQSVALKIIDPCGCVGASGNNVNQTAPDVFNDGVWQFTAVLKTNLPANPVGTPFDQDLKVRFTQFDLKCIDIDGCPDVAVGFSFKAKFDYLPPELQYGVQIDGTGTSVAGTTSAGAFQGDIKGQLSQDSDGLYNYTHFGMTTPNTPNVLLVQGIVTIQSTTTDLIPLGTEISFPSSIAFGFAAPTPEPAAIPMVGGALGLLAWRLCRRS